MMRSLRGLLLLVCLVEVQARPQEDGDEEGGNIYDSLLQFGLEEDEVKAIKEAIDAGTEPDPEIEQQIKDKLAPQEKPGEPALVGKFSFCSVCVPPLSTKKPFKTLCKLC